MSEREEKICKSLTKALSAIPDEKKEYFLGFAEGVQAAMQQTGKKGELEKTEEIA